MFEGYHWAKVSEEAKAFVKAGLTRVAGERPSAKALLAHPWLKDEPESL